MEYRCHFCNSECLRLFSKSDAKKGIPLDLGLCTECSLVQQVRLPTQAELHEYYSREYRQDYKHTVVPTPQRVHRAGRVASIRLRQIMPHLSPTHTQLCDIGAGGGELVYLAQRAGLNSSGLEPHEGYSAFAREQYGAAIHTGGLEQLPPASADILTLFHVLEHLPQPQQAVAQLQAGLRPGGLLVIEVPNILQFDASPHNTYFSAHLFYFSRPALLALLSSHFECVHCLDQGNLFAVFKRRDMVVPRQMPRADQVGEVMALFDQKGWLTYLTRGRGWRKLAARLMQLKEERSVRQLRPREILDRLHEWVR
ncbi:MAG: class I SAM-dependent methyltransferase [Alphaproteobacteria bacterium]|nr:class I SAM-dependent methyltransferase [Alphaproteobacteria bacterium]